VAGVKHRIPFASHLNCFQRLDVDVASEHASALKQVARRHQQLHRFAGRVQFQFVDCSYVCFTGLRALLEAMQHAVPTTVARTLTYRHVSAYSLLVLAEDKRSQLQGQAEQKRSGDAGSTEEHKELGNNLSCPVVHARLLVQRYCLARALRSAAGGESDGEVVGQS
jgi:hypothetical protein